MHAPRITFLNVLATILLVVAFVGVRLAIHPLLGDNAQLMLFILSVILAALVGNFYNGVIAAALSALAGIYFFIKPYYSLQIESNYDFAHVITFFVVGTVVAWLVEQLHQARGVAETKALEAEQEIIESRIAEERARESEERFRNVADNAPVLIWLADTTKKSVWFNKPWLEFTGRTMELEISRDWSEAIHPDDVERCVKNYNDCFDKRETYSMEYRLRRADGEYRWILDNGVPRFTSKNEFLGYIGSCTDIHERKQAETENVRLLEDAKQARAQAEIQSRLKDEFVGTVSHELRTPLNAILGWTQMLRSGMIEQTQHNRAIEVIERNARSQAQLIEDLLDITRITTGKLRLNMQPVNLAQVIEAAIDTVRPAADAKEIEIRKAFKPFVEPVFGDADRLQQVIWNLLSNAVKFSEANSRIDVQIARQGAAVEIAITDQGKGIEPDFLPYVFDRFRQQDAAATRKHGGLGLGLAIVRHIVELHGGTVAAESAGENQGATFAVRLPLRVTAELEKLPGTAAQKPLPAIHFSAAPQLSVDLQGLKVLVVDDETDARDLLTSLLTIYGADVTACSSGAEVLTVLPSLKPQILVSDIGMPQMDGFALIKKVREVEAEIGGQIPAIALTAFTRVEDRVSALAHGFQMFVPKPVEPSELVYAVKSLAGLNEDTNDADQSVTDNQNRSDAAEHA